MLGVLVLSRPIYRLMGKPGIEVVSRVSGLILASIGVNGIILALRMSFRQRARRERRPLLRACLPIRDRGRRPAWRVGAA